MVNQIKLIESEIASLEYSIELKKNKIKKLKQDLFQLQGRKGISWTEKSYACLKDKNEMMSADEILSHIADYRLQNIETATKRRGYVTALSVALNKLTKSGKIKSEKHEGVRGLYYGLSEWWNSEDQLLAFYRYSLNYKIQQIKDAKYR